MMNDAIENAVLISNSFRFNIYMKNMKRNGGCEVSMRLGHWLFGCFSLLIVLLIG